MAGGKLRPSKTALLALLANWRVENVSALLVIEGDTQTIKRILPLPLKESLRTLVSFELRNGIWVLFLSIRADIQWPKQERLLLMKVSSWMWSSFSSGVNSAGILNFSDPAKSTILIEDSLSDGSPLITTTYCKVNWKIQWLRELLAFAWLHPVTLFLRPVIRYSNAVSTSYIYI